VPLSSDARRGGKAWAPVEYEVGREKIREYAQVVGETDPIYYDRAAARKAGFRDVVAPPMFCVAYCTVPMTQLLFDPELGIDMWRLIHGAQRYRWGEPVCSGDAITTECALGDVYEKAGKTFYVFESTSVNQEGDETLRAAYTGIVPSGPEGPKLPEASTYAARPGRASSGTHSRGGGEPLAGVSVGDSTTELRVTPDRYVPQRYSGALGAFTPIHLDAEFARGIGLPGIVLHGLYTMSLVARAQIESFGGDPRVLRELSVQFRGVGVPEQEITVHGAVREIANGAIIVDTVAEQAGHAVIRNATAVIQPA
jgi:acyl dehydratase